MLSRMLNARLNQQQRFSNSLPNRIRSSLKVWSVRLDAWGIVLMSIGCSGLIQASDSYGSLYLAGSTTNANADRTVLIPAAASIQKSDGPGFMSASLTATDFAFSGKVEAAGGNDYDAQAVASIETIRLTLRFPDLPNDTEGYLEGGFRISAQLVNTFPGTHPKGEEFFAGGSTANFSFIVRDGRGLGLPNTSGGEASAGKLITAGSKVNFDTIPQDGVVTFRARLNRPPTGQALQTQISCSSYASVRAWSGNIDEPPGPWRGRCEVQFNITWMPPRFVTDSGETLPLGRVETETGVDVSEGAPRGFFVRPVVAASGDALSLDLIGDPGARFEVQSSPDLKTWTPVEQSVVAESGAVRFTLPLPPDSSRYSYRAQFQQ